MHSKKFLRLMIGFCLLGAAPAFAGKYGMAGCGLGSMIFEDQPGKIQILAVTTNDIVVPQTSAISTGSMNCNDSPTTAAVGKYIEVNQVALQKDVAKGNGETLSALLTLWKCDSQSEVGSTLQKNYSEIYNSNNLPAAQVQESMTKVLSSGTNGNLCKALI